MANNRKFLQKYMLFLLKLLFQDQLHKIPALLQAFFPDQPLGQKNLHFCSFAEESR
jgi:hypothetical protein